MSEQSVLPVESNSAYPEIDPVLRRRSRIKLLLILALFGVPLILASIYLQMVRSSGGQLGDTSRGQLIQPAVPLTEFSFTQPGEPFNLDAVRGSWTMLYVLEGECADACKLNLYHMRQVRLALNQRMDRVQRAVLLQSEGQLSEDLRAEHLGLMIAVGTSEEQAALRDQVKSAESTMDNLDNAIYLIDPFGNLMLRFPPDLEPKSMLKDIKHLLKVSRIG
ncbi:MAG: cytochrome oxidase Cu insertion factor (SCO1/SenC/PrrC family) [Granulosicoccus sp.]|jgi:cytochrome oxidase Cu insertion factor (SCO1/SenC/PrrC family)